MELSDLWGKTAEFLLIGVGVNYVVRKWVGDWLIDRFKNSDRRMTIWQHYMEWARGQGSHAHDVRDCQHDRCATI